MGEEIRTKNFRREDFLAFHKLLEEETTLLRSLFANQGLSNREFVAGFELEAWLLDSAGNANPKNEMFLRSLKHGLVVPELAKFNIELNGSPPAFRARPFRGCTTSLVPPGTNASIARICSASASCRSAYFRQYPPKI